MDDNHDGTIDFYVADLKSSTDYYAFGMEMKERSMNSNQYRYKAGTQEYVEEMGDDHYTAEFWEMDARLGRRWNIDPLTYPWQSSYCVFDNSPITLNDPLGLKANDPKPGNDNGGTAPQGGESPITNPNEQPKKGDPNNVPPTLEEVVKKENDDKKDKKKEDEKKDEKKDKNKDEKDNKPKPQNEEGGTSKDEPSEIRTLNKFKKVVFDGSSTDYDNQNSDAPFGEWGDDDISSIVDPVLKELTENSKNTLVIQVTASSESFQEVVDKPGIGTGEIQTEQLLKDRVAKVYKTLNERIKALNLQVHGNQIKVYYDNSSLTGHQPNKGVRTPYTPPPSERTKKYGGFRGMNAKIMKYTN